jgi:hypothetical protein
MKIFRKLRRLNFVPRSVHSNGLPSNLVPEPRTEDETPKTVHVSLIEKLPAEIKIQILASLGLEDLHAIIHASPAFYQLYILNRRSMLSNGLKNELGIIIIDAITVFQAQNTLVKSTSMHNLDRKDIQKFIKEYRARRHSKEFSTNLTEKEAISITHFYIGFIKPLITHYATWTLANIAQGSRPLSTIEEKRIVRALYRFELSCILFGYGPNHIPFEGNNESEQWNILSFLRIFEPWEIEEVSCIFAFAYAIYCDAFKRITWDLHRDNPKFGTQGKGPTPEGAIDLERKFISLSLPLSISIAKIL